MSLQLRLAELYRLIYMIMHFRHPYHEVFGSYMQRKHLFVLFDFKVIYKSDVLSGD